MSTITENNSVNQETIAYTNVVKIFDKPDEEIDLVYEILVESEMTLDEYDFFEAAGVLDKIMESGNDKKDQQKITEVLTHCVDRIVKADISPPPLGVPFHKTIRTGRDFYMGLILTDGSVVVMHDTQSGFIDSIERVPLTMVFNGSPNMLNRLLNQLTLD